MNTITQNVISFNRPRTKLIEPIIEKKISVQPDMMQQTLPIQNSAQAQQVLAKLKSSIQQNPEQAMVANERISTQFLHLIDQ